jgi:hypothetical protein
METLEAIQANRRKHRNLADKIAYIDNELAELIRHAFAAGYTGPVISAAANLSKERVYQIRDGRR